LKHFTELHSKGRFLALLANIRLGWKRMAVANTLAYFDALTIETVNVNIVEGLYSQHFIFFLTLEKPIKPECYVTLSRKGLPRINTIAY